MNKDFEQLLRKRAGISNTDPIPDNSTVRNDLDGVTITRGGSRSKAEDIKITRGGFAGRLDGVEVERPGEEGTYDDNISTDRPIDNKQKLTDFKITRGGTPGVYKDPKVTRTGEDGTYTDQSVKRNGTNGTYSAQPVSRSGESGNGEPPVITRGGISGNTNNDLGISRGGFSGRTDGVSISRGGFSGRNIDPSVTRPDKEELGIDIQVNRSGEEGVLSDINVTRPGSPRVLKDEDYSKLPPDVNEYSIHNSGNEAIDFISRIRKLSSALDGWTGTYGEDIPQVKALESQIKKLIGGTIGEVANTDLNAEDVTGYLKHMLSNSDNVSRLPLDIVLRSLLKSKYASGQPNQNPSKCSTTSNGTLIDKIVSGFSNLLNVPITAEELKKAIDDEAQFNSYYIQDNKLITNRNLKVGDLYDGDGINKHYKSDTGAYYYPGQRYWWNNFELNDDKYWSVSIFPYTGPGASGGNFLPAFPEGFDNGWWPITSVSFTKKALSDKSFSFPFFEISIPAKSERPRLLRISLLDNEKRVFQYWLESYIDTCFDIDKMSTLPYKNISFDITIYRLDCTLSMLYSKRLICVLSSHTASFVGAESNSHRQIDLEFSIVGEYMTENEKNRIKY